MNHLLNHQGKPKCVGVVGGGLSGIAVAYYLLKKGIRVTVFDRKGIGCGASGIAAGLLHPYIGQNNRLSIDGLLGMEATQKLLDIAGSEVYTRSGVLKLALPHQQTLFAKQGEREKNFSLFGAKTMKSLPFLADIDTTGLLIPAGLTVDVALYLKKLWKVCVDLGGVFKKSEISLDSMQKVSDCEYWVLAAGGGLRSFLSLFSDRLRFNQGELLMMQAPINLKEMPSIVSRGYLMYHKRLNCVVVGSTYRRNSPIGVPSIAETISNLKPKICHFAPNVFDLPRLCQVSGERVVSEKSYYPIAKQIRHNCFLLTGMGSRGLLYHALLGQKLAEEISAWI